MGFPRFGQLPTALGVRDNDGHLRAAVIPHESSCPNDLELMARLRNSDPGGLELLFDRYARLVLCIARSALGDHSEAEEVVQEVFFYLYQKSELYDAAKGSVRSWIVLIARSRALDRKLYLARHGFDLVTEIHSVENTLKSQTDLEQETEATIVRKKLEKALSDLTLPQRRTLTLFYFEGLDLRAISEQSGEPLGNVRHHFYRGLKQLRKLAAPLKIR